MDTSFIGLCKVGIFEVKVEVEAEVEAKVLCKRKGSL
jgi:hypothetical protein